MAYSFDFVAARRAVEPFVIRTPLLWDPWLTSRSGRATYLKLENLQTTGSFKVRGAANRILSLSERERDRGVVACSSGNHGRAVAHMAKALGVDATICVPEWADPVKVSAMIADGAEVLLAGDSYDLAEERAETICVDEGRTLIHPFDDPLVIAGQGTLGAEIVEVLPDVAEIVVPLSGGGLAGGVASAAKELQPALTITAVSAEKAAVMLASLEAGKPIDVPEEPTLAGALSGGIGLDNEYTFALVQDEVDRHIAVTEEDIVDAMAYALGRLHMVVEGGGAVALAAVLSGGWSATSDLGPLVIVVSGGNLGPKGIARVSAHLSAPGSTW
jgi:threonine dehydratase